jgi:hypothetical protein
VGTKNYCLLEQFKTKRTKKNCEKKKTKYSNMVERTVLVSKNKYKRMVTNKISLRDNPKNFGKKIYKK